MVEDKDHSALVARILHGARWATLLRLGAQVIRWGSTIVVVRYVSATDYGLNAMLETPLELLFLVCTLGFDLALVRARNLSPEILRPTFGWLLLVNAALFCIYFFGASLIAAYFAEPRLESLAKVLAFIFLLVPFRVIPNAMLDKELKFKLRAGVELISSVITAIATIVLAVLGFGIWTLITGILLNRTLMVVILMVLQPWFVMPSLRLREIRGLLAMGSMVTVSSAIAITANMLPVIVGGPLLGPAMLGVYAIAMQFASLPLSKVMPIINQIVFAAFTKFENQPAVIGGYVATCLGTGALLLLPVMVGLACATESFTVAVLGPRWVDSTAPLAVLSLAMPFRGITLFFYEVASGVGRPDVTLKSTVASWLVAMGCVLVGSRFGLFGLALAVAVAEPVNCVVTYVLVKRVMTLPIGQLLRAMRAAVASAALMAVAMLACGWLFRGGVPLLVLLAQVTAGLVTYGLVLRLLFHADARRLMSLVRP